MPSRLRVPLGYLFGFAALLLARPSALSLLAALPPVVLGEAIRLWASGHIEKTQTLATGGPYAHTRNPLYLGSVLLGLGVAVAAASLWVGLVIGAYLIAFYPSVIRSEAVFLRGKFGREYDAWAAAVPLFLPRPLPAGPRHSRFAWPRVRANKEWRTALAIPLVFLLLVVRLLA